MDFHQQEHPCKGQACRALCPSATGRDCLQTASSIYKWPPQAFTKLQGHLWVFYFPHFSDSFLKKKNAHFFIECHSGRKIGLQFLDLNLQRIWSLFFFCLFVFLIKAPHNLKFLHFLIIQFQNTKLIAQGIHGKEPSQQDSHRFHHERAARCPPLLFCLDGV